MSPEPEYVTPKARKSRALAKKVPKTGVPFRAGAFKYGEFLANRIIDKFRWSPGLGWMQWDEARWAPADEAQLIVHVRDMIADVAGQVLRETGPEGAKELAIMSSGSGISGTLRVARGLPGIFTDDTDWDRERSGLLGEAWLFPCSNGRTVELWPDGRTTVRDSDPKDMLTAVGCQFDPDAVAPHFERHFAEYQNSQEIRSWMMRLFAGTMRGVQIQQFHVWYGESAGNGKGTTQTALMAVFNQFAMKIPVAALMKSANGSSNEYRDEITQLRGKRIVFTDEPEEGQRFAAGRICEMTGGSAVRSRAMHRASTEFTPQFLLFMAANKRPRWGNHAGLKRRYVETAWDYKIDRTRMDDGVTARIVAEAPGILNLVLRSWPDWCAQGPTAPELVRAQTEVGAGESNTVSRFIARRLREATSEDAQIRPSTKDVYEAYREWCMAEGEKDIRPQSELVAGLKAKGWEARRLTRESRRCPVVIGADDLDDAEVC